MYPTKARYRTPSQDDFMPSNLGPVAPIYRMDDPDADSLSFFGIDDAIIAAIATVSEVFPNALTLPNSGGGGAVGVSMTADQVAGLVQAWYATYMLRPADPQGAAHWAKEILHDGIAGAWGNFSRSAEFSSKATDRNMLGITGEGGPRPTSADYSRAVDWIQANTAPTYAPITNAQGGALPVYQTPSGQLAGTMTHGATTALASLGRSNMTPWLLGAAVLAGALYLSKRR